MIILKMLTLKDIQASMGISKSSIHRMVRRKEPPFDKVVKAGRRVLLNEKAFETWALGERAQQGEKDA
jgi:excisionase family DNA binding protein